MNFQLSGSYSVFCLAIASFASFAQLGSIPSDFDAESCSAGNSPTPSACAEARLSPGHVRHALSCVQECIRSSGIGSLKNFRSCLKPHDGFRQKCTKFQDKLSKAPKEMGDRIFECFEGCKGQRDLQGKQQFEQIGEALKETSPELLLISAVQGNCSMDSLSFDVAALETLAEFHRATELLQNCGVVFLRGTLPPVSAQIVFDAAEVFLADAEQFLHAYLPGTAHAQKAGLSFAPNLRGGRFEVVPPTDPPVVKAVEMLGGGAISRLLGAVWKAPPELFVVQYMAQGPITWDQPQHGDSNTLEDAKVQLALQDYDGSDGPPEFFVGSHLVGIPKILMKVEPKLFPPVQFLPASAGDAIVYFSGLQHRGLANTGKRLQRMSLDIVLHSTDRFFHDSERLERAYIAENPNTKVEDFRKAWRRR